MLKLTRARLDKFANDPQYNSLKIDEIIMQVIDDKCVLKQAGSSEEFGPALADKNLEYGKSISTNNSVIYYDAEYCGSILALVGKKDISGLALSDHFGKSAQELEKKYSHKLSAGSQNLMAMKKISDKEVAKYNRELQANAKKSGEKVDLIGPWQDYENFANRCSNISKGKRAYSTGPTGGEYFKTLPTPTDNTAAEDFHNTQNAQ
jgi:hypothetical protein